MSAFNPETLAFIHEHRNDDVRTLALKTGKYPSVDMPAAITQIAGRQTVREKVPAWAEQEGILYPAHLSLEQCSSELTARHKADIIRRIRHASASENKIPDGVEGTFTDLTGGFGIDCAFLSACFREATYVERQEALCDIAVHNFPLLGLKHITVCHDDCVRHLQQMQPADWIFIDPARRDGQGGKVVAISDCEPDVAALEELLLEKAEHVLIKLSPMLDLALALNNLKHVQEAHIISVNNECKELLLVLGRSETLPTDVIPIHCTNLTGAGLAQTLTFCRRQEKESTCRFASVPQAYLYESNASILKGGAFRCVSHIYKVEKLHPNSHLYTSDEYISDFPGRKFQVLGSCGFGKKEIKELLGVAKRGNLTVRNFPSSVAELRKRLKLTEGGDVYFFATTLADEKKVLIRCRPMG
ncbi:THUMP-like domain-containing protein [Bacteroides heparinolyticus]|uniref:THUMP-like domain-containing protein n=1 Tax=Prevotella heparinolytica TaxID=28113 RepID=UPI00359FE3A0